MKNYKTLFITIGYFFIINIIFSLYIFNTISIDSLFFYFLDSIIFGSFTLLFSFIFKGKLRIICYVILSFVFSFLFISQIVHYSFYECFFSVYSLINGGQVFGFFYAILSEVLENIYIIIFIILLYFTNALLFIKFKDKSNNYKFYVPLITILCTIFVSFGASLIDFNSIYSRKNLLKSVNDETLNVQKFGLLTATSIDIQRFVFGFSLDTNVREHGVTVGSFDSDNYNILDTDFTNLSKKNEKLAKFFMNEKATNKNEYTGIFKNKNLIFITAESFSFKVVDKNLTPTLYKLQNDGFKFNNFYTPIYYASTSDGEYTNLTGILPSYGTWSFLSSINNDYPYSYANIFKEKGYKTYAFHNGEYDFYNRNLVMPNFGFDKYLGCGNGLENKMNCNNWTQSDEEMFENYKNDKHFVSYYMTISSHLPHDFKLNDMAKKHQDKVKGLDYPEDVLAYISSVIDLDKALENLINNLKKNNLLDDTVIVLVPDHYPYGLKEDSINEFIKPTTSYDKHKSGLIIYNSKIKGSSSDKYASNVDILPTLLNMFGMKYDSRLLIGKDIMSQDDGIVIFNDRSFLTSKGYYDEGKDKFYGEGNVSKSYINNTKNIVYNRVNASSLMLDVNCYKYLK